MGVKCRKFRLGPVSCAVFALVARPAVKRVKLDDEGLMIIFFSFGTYTGTAVITRKRDVMHKRK